jgi:hypothetical protein
MPEWNFFAFHANAVAKALLVPAQEAVRGRDLAAWQKVYDALNTFHYPPYDSGFSWEGTIIANNAPRNELSRDQVPDESNFTLWRCLQTFIELVSKYRLESRWPRVKHWVLNEAQWPKLLLSQQEYAELELFNKECWARKERLPDPFWCLASTSATDSNYIDPEMVARLAEEETSVGLFRRLAASDDIDLEVKSYIREIAAVATLVELAANFGLALYFREDGT